ncbi:MAG: fadE36 [Acidimicrobiales bacterium]|nr:fadE36 [Acidimicrobiales bacterium]
MGVAGVDEVPQPVVDLVALQLWMDGQGVGSGPISDAELLAGGTQNILLRFHRGGDVYVLRRPPINKRGNSDETMRREARVLAVLADTDVPHARLIAACPDVDVIGAAFYLMESVDGFNPTVDRPEPFGSDHSMQHAIGLAMADAIAGLGRVDHVATGLTDLGRGAGWLERQVARWRSQLESYAELDGYAGPELPGVDAVAAWLEAHQPTAWTPGLIHGDFHLANVLVRPDPLALAAVVDWELTTIADPLLDLGHLLATWPGSSPESAAAVDLPGLPTRAELIERYAAGSTRDMTHVDWYQVLACYRLGIILEGSNARADAGLTPRAIGDQLHDGAMSLFTQACALVGAA